jgi:hypothetical protein
MTDELVEQLKEKYPNADVLREWVITKQEKLVCKLWNYQMPLDVRDEIVAAYKDAGYTVRTHVTVATMDGYIETAKEAK